MKAHKMKSEESCSVELRDWFAIHAPEPPAWWLNQQRASAGSDLQQLARWRWVWADAMLTERNPS